jgi:hypothetical protein
MVNPKHYEDERQSMDWPLLTLLKLPEHTELIIQSLFIVSTSLYQTTPPSNSTPPTTNNEVLLILPIAVMITGSSIAKTRF